MPLNYLSPRLWVLQTATQKGSHWRSEEQDRGQRGDSVDYSRFPGRLRAIPNLCSGCYNLGAIGGLFFIVFGLMARRLAPQTLSDWAGWRLP